MKTDPTGAVRAGSATGRFKEESGSGKISFKEDPLQKCQFAIKTRVNRDPYKQGPVSTGTRVNREPYKQRPV